MTYSELLEYQLIKNAPEIIRLPEKSGQQKRRERRLAERKKKQLKNIFPWQQI